MEPWLFITPAEKIEQHSNAVMQDKKEKFAGAVSNASVAIGKAQ